MLVQADVSTSLVAVAVFGVVGLEVAGAKLPADPISPPSKGLRPQLHPGGRRKLPQRHLPDATRFTAASPLCPYQFFSTAARSAPRSSAAAACGGDDARSRLLGTGGALQGEAAVQVPRPVAEAPRIRTEVAPKILIQRTICAHHSVYDGATMAVAMRESWTDERLNDFRGEVSRRFDEVDRRFDDVDRRFDDVDRRFNEVDRRFDEVDDKIGRLDSKMDGLQRTIMLTGGGMIAALIGVIGTQV